MKVLTFCFNNADLKFVWRNHIFVVSVVFFCKISLETCVLTDTCNEKAFMDYVFFTLLVFVSFTDAGYFVLNIGSAKSFYLILVFLDVL